ncbi:MAG: CapA family protein [Myxococcaceae bacterium]|nr:CapA family protein [Myxococcaceae bacterium]
MGPALTALACAAALEGAHLVTALELTTRVDGRREQAELRWVIRRDENERGVAPHQSGWMDYGHTPWLNHHLAVVTRRAGQPSVRWMSSALELDGLFVEGDDVIVRSKGTLTRYVFRGWQLERSERPPDPSLSARRLAARFDTGLVHLAVVGDVMVGRATARALDVVGPERAFAEVRPVLARADLRLGNLESCFREGGEARGALDLVAPPRHLAALDALGFDALSLANNHCADADAAFSQALLGDAGIAGVRGAPWLSRTTGASVAVVALLAWPSTREALDAALSSTFEAQLRDARARADVVVALVHFGEEYERTPSAAQRRVAAWLFERGVVAVFGAHPHVQQPVEQPTGSTLVAWSLGNFLFDQEGYGSADGGTEEAVVLEVRAHRVLGLTWRATPFRIVGRGRLERVVR